MAFVDIKPTVHLVRLAAGETPFSVATPAQHPGRLEGLEIDEGFEIGRPQLPSRQAFCRAQLRDDRGAYETRRLQAGDVLIVQDTDDGGAATVRFRGRIRKPRVRDDRHGRILIDLEAHGLWTRIRQAADVSVPAIIDANGKQAVDSVLDQVPWPTSFRSVATPPEGTNINYAEWAFDGPPIDGIGNALAGINPRSKFFVDAAGVARVVWLSEGIQQFRANEVRPIVDFDDTELHVINQVVATALDVTRTTTTRHTSTAAFDLDDDADTVIFEGTLEGGDENARWAFEFRQPNGTYFPHHDDVNGSLTAVRIPGSTMFRVVATARARSGVYTTVVNFFQIRATVISLTELTEAPLVRNLNNIAPDEPRQYIVPSLAYPAGHAETLADNVLSLWGNPLQFARFEIVASNDAMLNRIRGLHLWQRISLFDGDKTHFGFVARRRWVYGQTYSVAHITIVEDFTEGGDISIPFRLPFEWVFVNLAAMTMLFDRSLELNNQGAWAGDTGGSTPTNNTGPTGNNVLPFVHTETSPSGQFDREDNGVLTAKEDTFDVIRSRDIVFRYAAYGDFAAGDGLVVQGRTVSQTTIYDLIIRRFSGADYTLWRISTASPSDASSPYGNQGTLPSGAGIISAWGTAPNGDIIGPTLSTNFLWRINPVDPDDETGDYGQVEGSFLFGTTNRAATIDANGDLLIVNTRLGSPNVSRVNILTPNDTTSPYGALGNLPSGFTDRPTSAALDANGDLWITERNQDSIWRINLSNTNDETGDYGEHVGTAMPFNPQAIAIDPSGDLWVIGPDPGTAALHLYRLDPEDLDNGTAPYGDQGTLPADVVNVNAATFVERTVSNFGAWTDIATLPASTYPAGNLSAGDTDTDVEGDDYTVVADGGWRDVTVSIPSTYQEIRLRPNLNSGGQAERQDIALRSIRSA